jgi:hypothetical protein
MRLKNGTYSIPPFRNDRCTTIISFKVIVPDEIETKGEIIYLSYFGEYCPDRSMRGYQLEYLLQNSDRYQIHQIMEQGTIRNYEISRTA